MICSTRMQRRKRLLVWERRVQKEPGNDAPTELLPVVSVDVVTRCVD